MNNWRKYSKRIITLFLAGIVAVGVTACGSGASEEAASDVQKVTIGIRQDLFPTSYVDDEGNPAGYDVEIMKAIDEKLEGYEFEYEPVSQEGLLSGLQTGKYAAAAAGFYSNDERREKYLFPQEYIGGNIIGIVVRKEDAAIKDLSDFASSGKQLVPTAPTSGLYGILTAYNEANPDNPVAVTDTDWVEAATEYTWINEERYDGALASKNVVDETFPQLDFSDNLVFNKFTAIKTWTLFHPDQQELADAYDTAIKELREDGTVSKLSEEFFGEDVLPYVEKSEE